MPAKNTPYKFWLCVDIKPGTDECWYWKYHFNGSYPVFMMERHQTQSHRWAFFFRYGRFPEPCGLHECDNPACCNWHHIFEGTQADNVADMIAKGRHNPGRGKVLSESLRRAYMEGRR